MRWLTRLSLLALFLATASAVLWLDSTRSPDAGEVAGVPAQSLPDYYLTGFRIERYTVAGEPRQILRGERLDHFPVDDQSRVRQPRLIHQPVAGPQWQIEGASGTLFEPEELMELQGDVRLHRPQADGADTFTLLTPQLTYAMGTEIARTDRAVRIFSPGTRVTATGMVARLAVDEVELLDRVRVRHDPNMADGATGDD